MRSFLTSLLLIIFAGTMSGQVAIKTNVLYDATATVNLGAELKVAPKWSVDLSVNLNEWDFNKGRRWRHWMIQPEGRYWLREAMSGHFFAANAMGGMFNIGHLGLPNNFLGHNFNGIRENYYKGGMFGIGVGYGYDWALNRHWNIEAELTIGYIYARYDTYSGDGKIKTSGPKVKNFFSPTKAAVSLKYTF